MQRQVSYSMLKDYISRGRLSDFKALWIDRTVKSKETKSLSLGSLIDAMAFNDTVPDKYVMADFSMPTWGPEKVMNYVYDTFDIEKKDPQFLQNNPSLIAAASKAVNYGQNWQPATVIRKVIDECSDYYATKILYQDKNIYSVKDWKWAEHLVSELKRNPDSWMYLRQDIYENIFQLELSTGEAKGFLDILHIDHGNNAYQIVDLKSSSDGLNFIESIVKYKYGMQVSFYAYLVEEYIKQHRPELAGYTMRPPMNIVVDTITGAIYLYQYNMNTLEVERYGRGCKQGWWDSFVELVDRIKNNNWNDSIQVSLEGSINYVNLYDKK